uniref:Uncharacterized protein n=1 Tax=Fagus sylvatica TaxID=28930 RepID=A0A2N9IYE2_FAGSY
MKSMQLKELNSGGYEVILVTSGAVGLGRKRLRYRRVANSSFCYSYNKVKFKNPYMFCSFADLQNPQDAFDGKSCASVRQSSLMASLHRTNHF